MPSPDLTALLAEAQRCILAGAAETGMRVAEQALQLAQERHDEPARLQALGQMGTLARMASRHADARRWLEGADAGYAARGDAQGMAQIAVQRGQMALDLGDYGDAIECFARGMQHASAIGDTLLSSRFLTGIGIASARVGDHARARDAYAKALALQRTLHDDAAAANTLHCMAVLELREIEATRPGQPTQGNMPAALQLLLDSLALARATSRRRLEGMCLNELGHAYRLRGGLAAVVDHCEQAIAIFRELPAPKDECDALLHIAAAELDAGHLDAAIERAEAGLTLALACGFRPAERDARDLLVRCREAAGDIAAAFAHLKIARDIDAQLRDGEVLRRIENIEHRRTLEQTRQRQAELEAETRALDHLATTDALTGLANRRALESASDRLRTTGASLALVVLDLDHFKRVNDRFGHVVGDVVLRRASLAMAAVCREQDLLARWGGEEFAVLLPNTDLDAATRVAERIRHAVGSIDWTDLGVSLMITASAGVISGAAATPLAELMQRADEALYCAKSDGRNRLHVGRG
ncbi:MAG: GGDEF domain-containing protein [Burkholderiales bacterium]|nr:GGDEF domain-containing protein [Burkholderiales bacterium]